MNNSSHRFGLDYTGRLTPAAHKAVGSSFAARYLSDDPSKNLGIDEAVELRNGGIDVVVVWETTADRALSGRVAGVSDAHAALSQAVARRIPDGRPIYFAVDFDETAAQSGAVAAYFEGVASVLGHDRTGAYGGYWTIKRLFDAHLISYGWQTYAWSGQNLDSRAQLYQFSNGHRVAGIDTDYDRALKDDFGQWDFKTVETDPLHYHDLTRRELQLVLAYDKLRKTRSGFASLQLAHLRVELRLRAIAVWVAAHRPRGGGWDIRHRGTRFQALWRRARGAKLA